MFGLSNLFYRAYPILIAAMLAAGAVWLERTTRAPEDTADAAASQAPDFMGEKVGITGFASNGELHYTLDTPHLTHFPQTDLTQVEQPRLQLFTKGRRVSVRSERGEIAPKGEHVNFIDQVLVERDGNPKEAPLRLATERITVWPQEQRAASKVPVRITQGEFHADANSLMADNIFGLMNLSGRVQAHFIPHNQRNP